MERGRRDNANTYQQALSLLTQHAKAPATKRVVEQIQRCAKVSMPLLIRGESGTGKELVALAVHGLRGSSHPLVTLNCGAIAHRLAESELFGHRKGAFTGATHAHQGAFERAKQGSVFLDELGELPAPLQPKLLRVLENGRYLPLGAQQEQCSKAQLIAATHQPLEELVQRGQFREDLLYRLNVLTIALPPLRQRREDLPSLLAHFATQAQAQLGQSVTLAPCVLDWAYQQPWPGNLRQLRNLVLRTAVLEGPHLRAASLQRASLAALQGTNAQAEQVCVTRACFASMKQELLHDALDRQGNLRLAANELGIPKSTLAGWLKKGDKTQGPISKTG